MKHPSTVIQYKGSLQDLAVDLGNLKYDALEEFLHLFAEKLREDSLADAGRNRHQLASRLQRASECLTEAREEIKVAWEISAPYMK